LPAGGSFIFKNKKMEKTFTCHQCGKTKVIPASGGTGYATDKEDNKICYDCCGINDGEELKNLPIGGKTFHYWNGTHITNWPGTLKIKPFKIKTSEHNWGLERTSIWFEYCGQYYYSYQIGHNSQVAHTKRIKEFRQR
jgi:hypothetical protein